MPCPRPIGELGAPGCPVLIYTCRPRAPHDGPEFLSFSQMLVVALLLVLVSTQARPAELAVDERRMPPAPKIEGEFRADVDPRGWWIGPEI